MTQNFQAYYLKFLSSVHPGIESIGQEKTEDIIRSDTLWGALIQSWMLLFDDECDELVSNPPFKLSSCFPFIGEDKYFPLPLGALDKALEEAAAKDSQLTPSVKNLKKVQYVSEGLFRNIIKGETITLEHLKEDDLYPSFGRGRNQVLIKSQRPRVKTNQLTGEVEEGSFFYCTDNFFSENTGLFFLAFFTNEENQHKFEAALRLLGDSGLGGDRSLGRGLFVFEKKDISFPNAGDDALYCLLSLYRPSEAEVSKGLLNHPDAAYGLIRRWGRASSTFTSQFRRADTWMLAEGSILPFDVRGTIPVVLEKNEEIPHNVYRYGLALTIPISKRGLGK